MKNKTLLITFLSTAAFVVGCDKEKTTAQQIDKVQTETKQAAQNMKDYTFAQKDEFRSGLMRSRLRSELRKMIKKKIVCHTS